MAQVPATQQPQPVLSHGIFFIGACLPAVAGVAGMDIPGIIIMEQGMEAALAEPAIRDAELLRTNPKATNKATICRLQIFSITFIIARPPSQVQARQLR